MTITEWQLVKSFLYNNKRFLTIKMNNGICKLFSIMPMLLTQCKIRIHLDVHLVKTFKEMQKIRKLFFSGISVMCITCHIFSNIYGARTISLNCSYRIAYLTFVINDAIRNVLTITVIWFKSRYIVQIINK